MVNSFVTFISRIFEANQILCIKKCIYCSSSITLKYGYVKGVQRYKCGACGRQFIGGVRPSDLEIWTQYSSGKLTYSQLSKTNKCSVKTIQRIIDSFKVKMPVKTPCKVVVLMNTRYISSGFGVMLLKTQLQRKIF